MRAEERGTCDMNGRYRVAVALAAGLLLSAAYAHTASAWSWTNDEAGQKLDREARHWLTTQNVCGVQLKPDYLKDLDARIVAHFTTMADEYRQFLLSSVWTANADYVRGAEPADIRKECEGRVARAIQAGVLRDQQPKPYPWGGTEFGSAPIVAKPAEDLTLLSDWSIDKNGIVDRKTGAYIVRSTDAMAGIEVLKTILDVKETVLGKEYGSGKPIAKEYSFGKNGAVYLTVEIGSNVSPSGDSADTKNGKIVVWTSAISDTSGITPGVQLPSVKAYKWKSKCRTGEGEVWCDAAYSDRVSYLFSDKQYAYHGSVAKTVTSLPVQRIQIAPPY